MDSERPIRKTLRRVRNRLAQVTARHDLRSTAFLLAMLATTMIWYEKKLYLGSGIRGLLIWAFSDLVLLAALIVLVRWLGIWRGWWPWVRSDALAHRIGYKVGSEADRLLNALQLEHQLAESPHEANNDLLTASVAQVSDQLAKMDYRSLTPRRYHPSKRWLGIAVAIMLTAWVTDPREMTAAADRLIHPERNFPAPTPFVLLSLTGDQEILGGDTTEVSFTAFDVVPSSIELVWGDKSGATFIEHLPLNGDLYAYQFTDMRDDITYFARYRNPSWFSPWSEIVTAPNRITLSDRPLIEDMQFTVTPPAYTGEPPNKVGGNVADIAALRGSHIAFEARTNLDLKDAWLNLNEGQYPVEFEARQVMGNFTLEESVTMSITVMDHRDVINANPIRYTLTALEDYPPTLTVLMPLVEVELDEMMQVPIQFDLTDDYGISKTNIRYQIRHPEYLIQDDNSYTEDITGIQSNRRSQRITYLWDLNALNLMPGDAVEFQIEVDDNNLATGPGRAVSNTMIARIPTLAELYAKVNERNQEAASVTEGVLEDLQEVQKLLDELDLAIRKNEDITWEEQQSGKELLQNLDEIIRTMEAVQEQLHEQGAKAEDNALFSESIQEKYDELQSLLQEIITPELQAAMDELRAALESIDPERMRQALQNLDFQADEFEAQLDRYLDIFRRAMAEMKMDEVTRRLEEMAAREEQLLEQASSTAEDDHGKINNLAARHAEQERALDAIEEAMRDAASAMEPFSPEASERLNDLGSSDLLLAAEQSMTAGTRSLQDGQMAESRSNLQTSTADLQALRDEVIDIQQQFQTATVRDMAARFQAAMNQALSLSRQQESLAAETSGMRRSSPRVPEMAERQHRIIQGNLRLMEQMMALSRESFNITPDMGRALGGAHSAMQDAVGQLTENNPQEAAKSQGQGMSALNRAALSLSNAIAEMQSSGSASGFEQFLERMSSLGKGQQGLNDQTLSMQLGQMGAMSKLEMMRRLQARQRQLSKVLDQILDDFPSQGGGSEKGLGKAREEMEEVIRAFQTRRLTRRTIDRQQKILNRLLDSQMSLTEQDFKEDRKGRTAPEQFAIDGQLELPADLGQREDLILRSMEKALRAGYSPEYQAMIRQYFRQLSDRISTQ